MPCLPGTVAIALQETFRNLRRLTELDLQSNELVSLGNELTALTCLRRLLINNNFLSHLPSDIHNLHNLELLDLRQDSEFLILLYDYSFMSRIPFLICLGSCLSLHFLPVCDQRQYVWNIS